MFGLGLGLGFGSISGAPAVWTPASLTPAAWFRGDVGSVSSWTDQSGNGRDAAAGTTAPTTTTLGGQSAFDFAGGAWFVNTTNSLVTAGSIYTVLAVAKASDGTGGTLLAIRRSGRDSGSMFLDPPAPTYIYTDAVSNTCTDGTGDDFPTVQSLFLSEHKYAGAGNTVNARVNRVDRGGVGNQGTEDGSTGFFIGKNSGGQPWNGKIAEIVVVARALTSDERTSWEAYVGTRYGI